MKFEGIYPPIITPHHPDGSIDRDGFAVMVEHLIESGVHGIIVGGTTGEYYAQSTQERIELMKLSKELINGRVQMIVGVGAIRTEDCIAYGEAAKAAGADGILVNAPYYACPDQLELANHALAIDRAVNLPIMLYNYPGRTGTLMDAEFFDKVGKSPNFMAIKESSGDINQMHMLAREYPHITLMCGMDDQALEFFAWGARSWVCAGSNFAPEAHIALYRACAVEGDFDKGRRIMAAMMPLMRVLEQGGKFIQTIKHGVTLTGIDAGAMRPPLKGLDQEEKRALEQVVRDLKATIAKIEAEG